MLENNDYHDQENYIDAPYYIEDSITPGNKNRKKGKFKALLAAFMAGMLFAFTISAASITVYKNYFLPEATVAQQTDQDYIYPSAGSVTKAAYTAGGSLTIPEIVQKAQDSVVGISARISTYRGFSTSTGTGIIYSQDGLIITNAHVVNGAQSVTVNLNDGTTYEGKIIGKDIKSDLAVIKISASGLKKASFGDSNKLVVGETAVAIGNPLGLEFSGTVTAGIISALNREINVDGRYMTLIQTDAAINPGNSGGPLLNDKGQVIGINTVKVATTETEGLGFAIPISEALPIIEQLIKNGYVTGRPSIGITGEDISAQTAAFYNIPQGFLVRSVSKGSGAELGGLQPGDIIIEFNGVTVKNQAELDREKDRCKAGDVAKIKVYRITTKEKLTLSIVLSEAVA